MTRLECLKKANECVNGNREQDYGTPEDNFGMIAKLWTAYINQLHKDHIDGHDVAAMMAMVKLARIATGHGKADNWVDLAGYAACGAELENKKNNEIIKA